MRSKILCLLACSIFLKTSAQNKWQPFAGLHLSLNSDAYYVGPSFSAGVQHFLDKKKKWSFNPEIHYFHKNMKNVLNPTTYETSEFLSYSVRSNFNYFTGKKLNKGFFVGGGIGFQFASDECYTYINEEIDYSPGAHYYEFEYGRVMFTINLGYSLPIKKNHSIQFLVSGIGPYNESDMYGSYTEVLSVLNTGVRFIF